MIVKDIWERNRFFYRLLLYKIDKIKIKDIQGEKCKKFKRNFTKTERFILFSYIIEKERIKYSM